MAATTPPTRWLYLQADSEAIVQIGARRTRSRAEQVSEADRERLWPELVCMYPGYARYQQKTSRRVAVIRLQPAGRGVEARS